MSEPSSVNCLAISSIWRTPNTTPLSSTRLPPKVAANRPASSNMSPNVPAPSTTAGTSNNNVILDTLDNAGSTNVVYPGSVLVAFNVTYNAGGRGVVALAHSNAGAQGACGRL